MVKLPVIMPRMRPVPIPTRGKPWWKSLWIWLKSTRKWEITEDWFFYIESLQVWVRIPKGFIFDGASIPKIFRSLLSPVGILFIPGLIHDFGYRKGYLLSSDTRSNKIMFSYFERSDWDRLFRDIAIQINGLDLMMNLPYLAVLIGGGFPWRKYRKKEKNENN